MSNVQARNTAINTAKVLSVSRITSVILSTLVTAVVKAKMKHNSRNSNTYTTPFIYLALSSFL